MIEWSFLLDYLFVFYLLIPPWVGSWSRDRGLSGGWAAFNLCKDTHIENIPRRQQQQKSFKIFPVWFWLKFDSKGTEFSERKEGAVLAS